MAPEDLDFERWARLAREDPAAFERERARVIGELIAAAPEDLRPRLEALQWRVEQVRRRARTPLAACLRISSMMWDRVVGEHGMLERLRALSDTASGVPPARPASSAQVLAFRVPARPDDPERSGGS